MYKKALTRNSLPLYIILSVLSADALSKYLTHLYLPVMQRFWLWYPYGGIPVFKNFMGIEFSISHQINYGAAWGVLASYQTPLLYVRMLLAFALTVYALFFNRHAERSIPFALIIAGAFGNILDYFFYGHVVDMFHFILWGYDFPVFNLADASIFFGITSLLVLECLERKRLPKRG
jgi:signal peptidase II